MTDPKREVERIDLMTAAVVEWSNGPGGFEYRSERSVAGGPFESFTQYGDGGALLTEEQILAAAIPGSIRVIEPL